MNIKALTMSAVIFIAACCCAGNAMGIDAIMLRGGDMQVRIALGMSEHELADTVGAPDIVKNAGNCYYYRVFDVSIMLDAERRIEQIYAGRNFTGALIKSDGVEAPVGDVFTEFGAPLVTVRRAYTPSTDIAGVVTVETENAPALSGGPSQELPLEYRGHRKLYELYSGAGVIKYKYVLDEEGIAFWLDADKKPYATVVFRTQAPAEAPEEFLTVFFDFDKDDIRAEYAAALADQARRIQDDADLCVSIEGHADEKGTHPYNDDLSMRRARAVIDYLAAQGAPASRMHSAAFGKRQPAAPNRSPEGQDNPEGRAMNRRVQIRPVACGR